MLSVVLLLIALLAVVLLSKKFSLVVDAVAARIGAPPAFAPDLLPEHADLGTGRTNVLFGLVHKVVFAVYVFVVFVP